MLGVVWAFRHFRCYLLGKRFLVRVYHRALELPGKFKEPSAIIARWLEFLSQFEYDLQYRQGRAHANADALSRLPVEQETRAEAVVNAVEVEKLPVPFVQRRNWSFASWVEAQSRDDDLSQLREWLQLVPPQTLPSLTGISTSLHKYWWGRQFLSVRWGVLCRCVTNEEGTRLSKILVLVPLHLRAELLTEYHDRAGHVGMTRLHRQLQSTFHWHGMQRDVEDFVGSCVSCSMRSWPVGRGKGAPLDITWAGFPFNRIAMDLIPGLPETGRGNKHILLVVDYFTKWVEAYPLVRMDAATIASVFVSEFVSRFGAPESLHTDQGRNFDSTLFKDVCRMLGIRKTRTTAYHPSGDWLVERFNQTLERLLTHYVADHQRDWDIQLSAMLMAYRATPQVSTGYALAYLLFGRELCLPQDVAYGLPRGELTDAQSQSSYAKDLRERLAKVHAAVQSKLGAVHRHQAHLRDSFAVAVQLQVHGIVWLLAPAFLLGASPESVKLWS